MMDKTTLQRNTRECVAGHADRILSHNLYFGAFEIQTDVLPVRESLEIAEHFFNCEILPSYGKALYKREQKLNDFFLFISNLFYSSKRRPLIVNLNPNYYDKRPDLSRFVIELKRIFGKKGYIAVRAGKHDRENRRSFITRVWSTEMLWRELFEHPDLSAGFHVESIRKLIILKERKKRTDKKNKTKELRFRKTKYTNKLTKNLQLINDVNRQHAVVLQVAQHQPQMLMTDLHAVFNGSFDYGGRFYTRKRVGYQAQYRDDRPEITIDGKRTVELDYSGLHPHLLYASVGRQYDKGDPYSAVDYRKALREVLKMALLTLLNSSSEAHMVKAGNYYLFNEEDHYQAMRKYNLTIKGLLQEFKKAHQPIAHFFCTGQGLALMNIDAKIALKVLLFFANRGEACLCIHDSFIVESKNDSLLREIMTKSYQEITATISPDKKLYNCPIK